MIERLYDHQKRFLEKNPNKSLLCWQVGSGKTLTALLWAIGKGNECLVVCPKSILMNWIKSIEVLPEYIETTIIDPEREAIVKLKGITFTVLSKERFKQKAETMPVINTVVIDEAHMFASLKSQMSKRLFKYLNKNNVQNRLLLSGTVYTSTPWSIYTIARHLGYKWNYPSFSFKYFDMQYVGKSRRMIPVVKEGIEEDMAKLVAQIGDIVRLDECVDVPEQVFIQEYFTLNQEQKRAMKEIVEVHPIVRFTKHHEIQNSILKSDGYTEDRFFSSDKIDRIKELCAENKKIAIICRYNLQIDLLKRELESPERKIYIIRGDVKDRAEVVKKADADPNGIVLINSECAEGYELPSINLIIFASLSFSFVKYSQICGRFLRINKLTKNIYLHLIVKGEVDEAVYQSIKKKENFSLAIFAQGH